MKIIRGIKIGGLQPLTKRLKKKLIYSYAGCPLCGAVFCLLMQSFSFLFVKKPLSLRSVLLTYLVISAALTLFLAASCFSLNRHEGFRPRNLAGIALGLGWTAGNLFCLALLRVSPGRILSLFPALLGCYFDYLLTGILWMGFLAARHKPAYDKDFVIIPGCSISKQGGLLPLLKGRTNRAIRFAWDQERATGKPVRYIPTGGQGPDEIMSEGSAMEFYLLSHGAEQYEVLPEKTSVNTYENMLFSKRLIDEVAPEAKTCFVTTNYHVLRSGILARKVGLDAEGLASDTKWYFWPNGFAREVIAVLVMAPWLHLAAAGIGFLCAWLGS